MLPNPGGEQLEQFRPRSATQIGILTPHSLSTLRQSLMLFVSCWEPWWLTVYWSCAHLKQTATWTLQSNEMKHFSWVITRFHHVTLITIKYKNSSHTLTFPSAVFGNKKLTLFMYVQ